MLVVSIVCMQQYAAALDESTETTVEDVRAGLQKVLRVFITHSCNVFLLDTAPPGPSQAQGGVPGAAHPPGGVMAGGHGADLVHLEDQVGGCSFDLILTVFYV